MKILRLFLETKTLEKSNESLVTFMTSLKIINEYWPELIKMASEWTDPWEETLHEIYKKKIASHQYHLCLCIVLISILFLEFRQIIIGRKIGMKIK